MEKLAIIFDLDGTLIESGPDIHASLCQVLRDNNLPQVTYAQTRSFVGRGVPTLIARARDALGLPDDPQDAADMIAAFNTLYVSAVDKTVLFPNVTKALAELKTAETTLALCTNKPEAPTHAVLRHFGLDGTFQAMSFGDGPYKRKPDPAPVAYLLDQLQTNRAIYVGDSETDAETALAAGVPFLLFTEGYRKTPVAEIPHRAAFSDFAALPALLAAIE